MLQACSSYVSPKLPAICHTWSGRFQRQRRIDAIANNTVDATSALPSSGRATANRSFCFCHQMSLRPSGTCRIRCQTEAVRARERACLCKRAASSCPVQATVDGRCWTDRPTDRRSDLARIKFGLGSRSLVLPRQVQRPMSFLHRLSKPCHSGTLGPHPARPPRVSPLRQRRRRRSVGYRIAYAINPDRRAPAGHVEHAFGNEHRRRRLRQSPRT
jgi:hypothetical protein